MEPIKLDYLECACYSDEHTLKFAYDPDENEMYVSVYLHTYESFFKRVWTAIKFVFGYKSKYGHWDCFLLNHKDKDKFISIVSQIK